MKIGPMFSAELQAAGVLNAPIVWTAEGVTFDPSIDDDTRAKVEAVIAAHDPTKAIPAVVSLAVIDLYRAMTDDEFARMQAGVATQSPRIQGIFARAVTFRSDAPEWSLLQHMAETLYGKERAAELLTPPA